MTLIAIFSIGVFWLVLAATCATVPHRARRAQPRVRPALTVITGGRS